MRLFSLSYLLSRSHQLSFLVNLGNRASFGNLLVQCQYIIVHHLDANRRIDTGRGIPADILGSIFERFKQVDASDSRERGTGLGLPICYKIVEEHGGSIWAKSKFGEGSTFYLTLPKSNSESSEKLPL